MDKPRINQQLEQLCNLYIDEEYSFVNSGFLEECIDRTMKEDNAAPTVIACINKCVITVAKRGKGLALLNKTIIGLPLILVVDNAITWVNICIKEPVSILQYNVLRKILEVGSGNPDFNKSIVTSLGKIIDICISAKPDQAIREVSLDCLKLCLQKFPSPCGPYANKTNVYLSKYVSSEWPVGIIRKAGSAFNFLQQVGGSGPDGITHRKNWSNQFNKLCATVQTLYNQFFAHVTEFDNKEISVAPFMLAGLYAGGDSSIEGQRIAATCLKNVVTFIMCMLVESYPVEKDLHIVQLLDVFKRGLQVDTFSEHNSVHEAQFANLLCVHQIDLLYLLHSLIARKKRCLMPFSFTITKLLMDCLQRTRKNYFSDICDYQKAVYTVLRYWIITAENDFNNTVHNKLVSFIVSDISCVENSVVLCLTENVAKNKSGKAKKRAVQQMVVARANETVCVSTNKLLERNEKICVEALKTGGILLLHVILKLDQDTYKMLFQTVTQHLTNIQGGKILPPYSNPTCQAHLYKLLFHTIMQPAFCVTPLLQTAINIFVRGQNAATTTTKAEIFSICTKALETLEKISQPICPTLSINQQVCFDFVEDGKSKKKILEFEVDAENESEPHIDGAVSDNTIDIPLPSNSRKIRVLDDKIIKPNDVNDARMDDSDVSESERESPLIESIIEIKEHNLTLDDSIKEELSSLSPAAVCKNEAIESPAPSMEVDEDELAMLDSFKDVVN